MKRYAIAFLFFLCWGCDRSTETVLPYERAEVDERPVVSQQDIDAHLEFLSDKDRAFAATPIGRQNLLQLIVREKLIAADAHAQQLQKTPEYKEAVLEKKKELDGVLQMYAADLLERQWYDAYAKKGTFDVSEEEIDAYYKKYPYEMTVRQIILDNAQTADEVLRALKRSHSRWQELERQYSIAPEALRGSNVTFMPGEFLPEIEVIAANSSTGSVQGFIKTSLGFHIIMKTSERRLSKKDAAPRIRAILEQQKLDRLLENLQTKYEVIIHETNE